MWYRAAMAGGGIFGGITRGLKKFAANTFLLQSDNSTADGDTAEDGRIRHRWVPEETLLQFMWYGMREPLLPLVRR